MASRRAIRAVLGSDDPSVSDSLLGSAWSWEPPPLDPAVPVQPGPSDTGLVELIDACVDELCGNPRPPTKPAVRSKPTTPWRGLRRANACGDSASPPPAPPATPSRTGASPSGKRSPPPPPPFGIAYQGESAGVPIPVIDDAPTLPHDPALRPLAPRRIRVIRIRRAA